MNGIGRNYKGVSFPFSFDSGGGTSMVELTPDDLTMLEQSLRQIWLTSFNETPMELKKGSNVRSHVFESLDDITDMSILKYEMIKAANKQEPRIAIKDITFTELANNDGALLILVTVFVVKFRKDATLQLVFNRT